jgi:hypothetical protein
MANKLIDSNPKLKKPALVLLDVCARQDSESRAIIEDAAAQTWPAAARQSVASVLDALVRSGCLSEQITIDGCPYDGTLEDVYRDDTVDLDANVDAIISITAEGLNAIEDYKPESTLSTLLSEKHEYETVFLAALDACCSEGGASRNSLEDAIEAAVRSGGVTASGGGRIYPQYFIDALESAGGIEWDGSWRITSAGLQFVSI